MKSPFVVLIVFILLYSCQKDEELLTGDISGNVQVIDQYFEQLQDQSGVEVKLFKEDILVQETNTGINGEFVLGNVEYGKYTFSAHKEGYVKEDQASNIIYHVGGYSPTPVSYSLYEVPSWEIFVDSIKPPLGTDLMFMVHLKINGDTLPPSRFTVPSNFLIRAYASNSPDVSKDNYTARTCGYLLANSAGHYSSPAIDCAVYGILEMHSDGSISFLRGEKIYMRLYPIAGGQYSFSPDNPDALGKPSNLIEFDWE